MKYLLPVSGYAFLSCIGTQAGQSVKHVTLNLRAVDSRLGANIDKDLCYSLTCILSSTTSSKGKSLYTRERETERELLCSSPRMQNIARGRGVKIT